MWWSVDSRPQNSLPSFQVQETINLHDIIVPYIGASGPQWYWSVCPGQTFFGYCPQSILNIPKVAVVQKIWKRAHSPEQHCGWPVHGWPETFCFGVFVVLCSYIATMNPSRVQKLFITAFFALSDLLECNIPYGLKGYGHLPGNGQTEAHILLAGGFAG